MNADEVLGIMSKMTNSEKDILLDKLYHMYYDNRPSKEVLNDERYKVLWGEDDYQ
ncbi:hypothetical protein MKX79_04075 [Viridibacillus sp. FSL R5-0468]|uniref:hypothetical protein n=1 Tax=Viridibacillus sp. FSL R5-0468 TaxID=2921640 RepID=UPI0030F8CCEB